MITPSLRRPRRWLPGRDTLAVHHPGHPGRPRADERRSVVVIGGGIAGLAAATALAERGVAVTLLEREATLGGRVRAWPVEAGEHRVTMSRGFHAFFRQYYNLRQLLRRADPELAALRPVADYPLLGPDGATDSFARVPRTPPLSFLGFVARSPSFRLADLGRVDLDTALGLLDVDFPATYAAWDGLSAADFLTRLRFPDAARHLALEVFARSFFAHPTRFAAGELVAMFHSYFLGSAEGLLFDVPVDDYDTSLWAPLGDRLQGRGVVVRTGSTAAAIELVGDGDVRIELDDGTALHADAVVVAADPAGTTRLLADTPLATPQLPVAPPFAVWRLWLDRPVRPDRAAFLGVSGHGPLDNVSVLDRFEAGAREWARSSGGSVVELHAYALPAAVRNGELPQQRLQRELRQQLATVYPETREAVPVLTQWRVDADCPLVAVGGWHLRPTVTTADPRVVLAGDGLRCDWPVALMERAATTGLLAANALLRRWDVRGHDLWTVPTTARHRLPGRLRSALPGRAQPMKSPRARSVNRRSA